MRIRPFSRWLLLAPIAMFVLLIAAACGDDDSTSSNGGGSTSAGGGTGTDEKFVGDICKAAKTFSADLEKVTKDPNVLKDPKKAVDAVAGPFTTFSDAFTKANPPKDLKSWHDDASKKFKDYIDTLKKSNDISTAFSGGNPIPPPPKDAADRLQKVAASNQDCKDSNFDFTD